MDAQGFQDAIESDYETELSRLGSSKAIYAATEGEMETAAVLESMAGRFAAAATTFEAWADDEPHDGARDTFETAAARARDHADRVAETAGIDPEDAPTPLQEYLRGLDDTVGRAAGLAAWATVADRLLSQAVGFFVGNADTAAADLFRDLRSETASTLEDAHGLLDAACDDWERATAAASDAVEAAYDHYVEVLEGMGVKVKPVC